MSIKFPHVIIPVFHPNHLAAAVNEAERLGYRKDMTCPAFEYGWKDVQAVHLKADGSMYAYSASSAEYLINHPHPRYEGAIILNKLRKLRGLFEELNPVVTESQDNQSQLIVYTGGTFKQDPHATLVSDPDNYLYRYGVPDAQIKTCTGCITTKECTYRKAYGGKCIKSQVIPELAAETKSVVFGDSIVWTEVKPSLMNRITRRLVLAGSKVVSVFASVIKFLRGTK